MKRIALSLLATLCLTTAALPQDNKLVIASFYPVDKVSGWNGLLEAFNAKYPGVEIEVQVTPQDQYLAKLLSQIAGGDAPDIVGIENSPFPQFVNRNILEDLTPMLAATESFKAADFFPHLLDRYTVDAKVYGIPYDAQPNALMFYNPGVFEAAGVDQPTADWNWDQMRDASKKLADAGGEGSYGLCMSSSPMSNWLTFLYGGGGALVDDVKAPTKSLLDSPESIAATQYFVDMMLADKSVPTNDSLEAMGGADQGCTSLFLNGKAGMMIIGMWKAVEAPEKFRDLGIKLVMAPTKDTANRVYPTGGTAYSILKTSKNKEMAWNFLQEFLGQAGFEAAYKEATLGAIYPPANIPAFDWYAKQPIEFLDTLQPNADALAYIRFAPFLLNWGEIESNCITPDLDFVLNGSKPVGETLTAMAACINGEL